MAGISLNEDDSHYLWSRGRDGIAHRLSELQAWADQYAGTQVRELILATNGMRTNTGSRIMQPLWDGYDPNGGLDQAFFNGINDSGQRKDFQTWVHAAWEMRQAGLDMYRIWIERCREHGISPCLSVRMNDVHFTDVPEHFGNSAFWRAHPEFYRVGYRFAELKDRALDYGRQEVRDYFYGYIEELVGSYDLDGLELDWQRFGFHFRPGCELVDSAAVNAFVADVRALLDTHGRRRGRAIALSVRVPARPDAALYLGLDAAVWAQEGHIDTLVAAPFWETVDTDMPLELWKRLLRGTNVTLAASLELLIRAYPESPLRQYNSLETVRGAAAALLHRGADRIYLFNYMDSDTTIANKADYPKLLREVGDLATLRGKHRRHVLTYPDTLPVGEARCARLPVECRPGRYEALRLSIGPAPEPGTTRSIVWLGIAAQTEEGASVDGKLAAAPCRVLVNGTACAALSAAEATDNAVSEPLPEEPLIGFAIPDDALRSGFNIVEVVADVAMTVTWAEIGIG